MTGRTPPRIFDRATYRARRRRAERMGGDTYLVDEVADQIGKRLNATNRRFSRALDLGSRTAGFVRLTPLAAGWTRMVLSLTRQEPAHFVVADEEALPFADESFDLVVSVLGLHAVNDLPGTLAQIRKSLRPDGLFIGALFAGETLNELRLAFATAEAETAEGVSPRVAPFAEIRDLGGLLQRVGFALPVADLERTTVRYREISSLFGDLRAIGETNSLAGRATTFLRRRTFEALVQAYAGRFSDIDGKVRATFDIVYLSGWAPHGSQRKPLAPGSAKARLVDVLGAREGSAGGPPKANL